MPLTRTKRSSLTLPPRREQASVSSRRSVGLDKAVLCEIATRKRLADRLSEAARVGVTVFAIAPPDRHSSLRLRHSMFIHVDELATHVEMKEAARNPDRTVAFLGARQASEPARRSTTHLELHNLSEMPNHRRLCAFSTKCWLEPQQTGAGS